MAKSRKKSGNSGRTSGKRKGSKGEAIDSLAKAPLSREMLSAGLTAAATAIAADPTAHRKIRDAGLDAAESTSRAATAMISIASKLGTQMAEAVLEAAQDVFSGKWATNMTAVASAGASKATTATTEASKVFEADQTNERRTAPAKRGSVKRSPVKPVRSTKRSALTKSGAPRAKPGPKPRLAAASPETTNAPVTAKPSSPPKRAASPSRLGTRARKRAEPKPSTVSKETPAS